MDWSPCLRVLCVQELLLTIFHDLDKPSAATAARVCKAWENAALDVLWEDIPCVTVILRLFGWSAEDPHVCLFAAGIGTETTSLTNRLDLFTKRVSPSFGLKEWTVFSKYAPRIRTLYVAAEIMCCQEALQAISCSRPQLHILPNLISLDWNAVMPPEMLNLAYIFISPSLRIFQLAFDGPVSLSFKGITHLLEGMASRVPDLRTLTLDCSFGANSDESLCRVLSALPRLTGVALQSRWVTRGVYDVLGRLLELQQLLLRQEGYHDEDEGLLPLFKAETSHVPDGSFPSLQHISLDMGLRHAASFLPNVQHTSVKSVDIGFAWTSWSLPTELRAVLEQIALVWPLLERIRICLPEVDNEVVEDVTMDVFKPILGCTRIMHFHAVLEANIRLTDDDMRGFAMAWPNLRSFHLRDATMDGAPMTDLSPQALVHFARHCPTLEDIGLFVDLTAWRYEPQEVLFMAGFSRLKYLHFGGSRFAPERWAGIVDFLLVVCPRDITIMTELEQPLRGRLDKHGLPDTEVRERTEFWRRVQVLHHALRERDAEHQIRVRQLDAEIVALKQQVAAQGNPRAIACIRPGTP